jgi:alpha-2-macroglobulin-like protein
MNFDRQLSPGERERLAQELLELHFGCHADAEHLEARLAAEPELRALQAEVLQQAALLERAVRPEQAPLQLRQPPARSPSRWRRLRSPMWRVLGTAAAAALVVGGLFVAERFAANRHRSYQCEHLHLTVSAPRAVPAGAPWSFTVQTKDLTGAAVDCKIRWEALLPDGAVLAASEAPTQGGQATVAMVADTKLRVPDRIVITAANAHDSVRQVLPLSTAAAGPLVHVATDRPVYRPGERVFVRAVVLDRITRLPLATAQPMSAQLLDPKGAPVVRDDDTATPAGVGSFALQVPADSAGGPHTVQIASHGGAFPTENVEIVVRSFQAPQLQMVIVLDRTSYAPGARGAATITVQRLAAGGGGASGASARGALVIDGTEVWSEQRVLGVRGDTTFAFVIPKDVAKGAARFVATITDSGIVETEVKPFVVPTGKVQVAAFPEGGELIAGVECGLYLESTDSLGRPIDGTGEVLDARGQPVARFRTQHQGRVKLALVPRANDSYRVRLTGHAVPFPLPAVQPNGIALRLLGDDVDANEPLRVAVAGRGDGPWLLGVFCRGVLVGQTTLRPGEDGELHDRAEIALPPTATGVLRVTVFDRNLQPIAERLIRRHAQQRLDVALAAQHASLAPGDAQQITVRTTDENGAPRAAVVGLGVADLAAISLGSEPAVGLVDQAMLFADVERMENLGDFFLGKGGAATNVDLLLGTRGWRRFVWRNDAPAQAAIAARGDAAAGTLAREGFSHTPQVASNLAAANASGIELGTLARRAERRLSDAAEAALIALLLLLLVEALAWVHRRTSRTPPLFQGFVGAGAATVALLAVVAVLMPRTLGVAMLAPAAERAGAAGELQDFAKTAAAVPASVASFLPPPVDYAAAWLGTNLSFDEFDQTALFLGWSPRPNAPGDYLRDRTAAIRKMMEMDEDLRGEAKVGLPFNLGAGGWDDRILANAGGGEGKAAFVGFITHWRERQYAHQHVPTDNRTDFTPTIYWNTLVATDANGNAAVTFATSDAVTTWRVHADAHTPVDTGRLGQADFDFSTRLPLHVEAKLPDEVSAGDQLLLPVSAVVTDATLTEVTFTTTVAAGLRLQEGAPTRIALQQGRGRALLPLTVDTTTGIATIQIEARAGRFVDRVQHRVTIAPRGFPHRRSLGGAVEAGKPSTGTVTIPADAVAGSGRVTLKVFPSPLAALTEGLQGILQEPHGCFEQASSSNYPNTLVLNLLEASGDNVPAVAARARELLPRGYAKITGYECKQKGYEWFGADPGHEALTAYGLMQFHDMAKVFDVDAAMVERTKNWLLARRDGNGGYGRNPKALDRFGGASEHVTNAYVTFALLQAGTPAAELTKEITALVGRASTTDPYELALISCALHVARHPEAQLTRQRLAELQTTDGALRGAKTSITKSGGNDLVVESTGFAILAWLPDQAFVGQVRKALEFVQGSRTAAGTFGATQATIVALRALTAYATTNRTMRAPGTLRVFAGDRTIADRAFTADETTALTFELWDKLPPGEHTLRLEVEGGGDGSVLPWACDVAYHAEQPADDPDTAVAITTALRRTAATEGDTVALDIGVTNRTPNEVPTPIAIVGLPAGCELPTRVLEDLQKADAFAFWELRGRELVLYWRALAPGAEQKLTLDLVARVPGTTSGPASRSYLYYTPAQKRWAAPVQLTIAAR